MGALVTVVIVNWNGGAYLHECLQALAGQTEGRFQAVIVDNASSDGSQSAVRALGDERFELLQLEENTGFARASNLGVAAGAAPWIALLNPDAFPHSHWLEELVSAAMRRPEFAFFSSHLIGARDHSVSDGTGDIYHLSGRAFRRDHGAPITQSSRAEAEVFGPCAAAALYSRSAWTDAGGLDEDFFCYMEDVDMAFRMRLLGYRCLHVPAAKCHHVGSAVTGAKSEFSGYHGQRNLVWAYVKNMPFPLFWLLLPAHLVLNLLALMAFAARGQFGVVLRAKRDALAGLPGMWQKRSRIQARRKIRAAAVWAQLDKRLWPQP